MAVKHKIAVVKVGGDVLLDEAERNGLARNIKQLIDLNWRVIVLHGGGPQTNRLQTRLGLKPNKVAGRRITQAADLQVVKQAIAGEVNVDLTACLQQQGVAAFGCHGASGQLIRAEKRPPMQVSGYAERIDFGQVGDVTEINVKALMTLLDAGFTPVIATLGLGRNGEIFNINADTTVVKIAAAVKADRLFLTTQVGAVFEDLNKPESRIEVITPSSSKRLIESGVINGGMIPKVEEAISLLDSGVGAIAIVSGRNPQAFLSVIKSQGLFGTVITREA
ncbi:MAG: acetylglutamate kinase [Gammaproteobacteria bacterium]|nr:acetylglutamate kinase [Gammaproteobacteria bacterium]